jgi:hypothetical protein
MTRGLIRSAFSRKKIWKKVIEKNISKKAGARANVGSSASNLYIDSVLVLLLQPRSTTQVWTSFHIMLHNTNDEFMRKALGYH